MCGVWLIVFFSFFVFISSVDRKSKTPRCGAAAARLRLSIAAVFAVTTMLLVAAADTGDCPMMRGSQQVFKRKSAFPSAYDTTPNTARIYNLVLPL
jgi:hypothetical protein